jgi:hypothetical protein
MTGKLNMKDFANSYFNGDCFYIAGVSLGLNSNNSKDFVKICNHIITHVDNTSIIVYKQKSIESKPIVPIKNLDVLYRDWRDDDIKYWSKYTLPIWFLEQQNVLPIYKAWFNEILIYIDNKNEPCYMYNLTPIVLEEKSSYFPPLGESIISKLYLPNSKPKFKTNNVLKLEDNLQLIPNDILIIVKSTKDKIVLRWLKYLISISNIYKDIRVNNIEITAISSESVVLSKDEVNILFKLYKHIFIFTDFDIAGISCAYEHFKLGLIPIFLKKTNVKLKMFEVFVKQYNNCNYKSKDISDYLATNGIKNTLRLVVNFIKLKIYKLK